TVSASFASDIAVRITSACSSITHRTPTAQIGLCSFLDRPGDRQMLLEYLWRRAKVVMRRNHALQNEKAGILEECRPFEGAAQRRAAPGRGVRSTHGPLRCNGWSDLRFGLHPRPAFLLD